MSQHPLVLFEVGESALELDLALRVKFTRLIALIEVLYGR